MALRGFIVIVGLTLLALLAIGARAEAAECRPTNSGRMICKPAKTRVARHYRRQHHVSHVKHAKEKVDANGNSLFAVVHTANGLTAKVIASAREKFQNFIDAVETDHIEPETFAYTKGHRIGDIGCKSTGHMPGSKHLWGGACDFDQKRRNVTSAFMYHVTSLARKFGLIDGCTWASRRGEAYTGPDCGHIEVPGSNSARRNPTYRLAMR